MASKACCTIPPVHAEYSEKGTYIEADGFKTYKTGPSDASTAILIVYDIFGFAPQTLQGADILATSDSERKYQVFMPDLFHGKPLPHEVFPPGEDKEKQKIVGDFFAGPASPPDNVKRLPGIVEAITKQSNGTIKKWAAVGYCWGGKVVGLTSGSGTPFAASAQAHPAMVDPEDAKKITIPHAILASKDEDPDAVKKFEAALSTAHHVETFGDQIHGWMAARSDLKDERVRSEYQRGYKTLLSFFHDNL